MRSKYLVISFVLISISYCAQVPKGKPGVKAQSMVAKMQAAAGYQKWLNETAAVSFEFAGKHKIFWDKKRDLVEVKWGDCEVWFDKKTLKGIAKEENKIITDAKKKKEHIKEAFSFFINDTFWLNPVYHFNSSGAQSFFVEPDKLLISYTSGGVTPGDSYLFEVDEKNRIKSMRMWVSIIPFKGVSASFSEYKTTATGVPVATKHKTLLFLSIDLDDLKMYKEYPVGEDRFADLRKIL